MAESSLPDGTVIAWRYRLPGDMPAPLLRELRLRHDLGNKLVELWKEWQGAVRAAWEEDPEVGPLLAAQAAAEEAYAAAAAEAAHAAQRHGYARHAGTGGQVAAARAAERDAKAARRAAKASLDAAKTAVREVKGMRYNAAFRRMDAARQEYEAGVRATRGPFVQDGGFWANWDDAVAGHRRAAEQVAARRRRREAADLSFRAWDGTGTVTVVLQRQRGVSAEMRADVTARRAAGESNRAIGADYGRPAMAIAKIKPDGPVTEGDPPRLPATLASPGSPWRNVLGVSALPDGFGRLPRHERRTAARQGVIRFRTGSEEQRAVSEMRAVIHRPMRADADITYGRVTVSRRGPDLLAHVSLTAKVPAPAPRAGRRVRLHAGWRALPDGSLRVAVIAGAGPLPAGLAQPSGPARPGDRSVLDGCVRPLPSGGWEVVIPAAWKGEQEACEKARGRRDDALAGVREQAAAWIAAHPQPAPDEGEEGPEALPAPAAVRQWRAPRRLAALGRRCRTGVHGPGAVALGELIGAWAQGEEAAHRAEARARSVLAGRRADLYGRVAAWLCAGAGELVTDEHDMAQTARRPRDGDDPQAQAARGNRVLAAPGELRSRCEVTAVLAGVAVARRGAGDGGQVHAGCGGALDPDERRRSVMVRCAACGAVVDQDVNMLALMAARE